MMHGHTYINVGVTLNIFMYFNIEINILD